MSALLAVLATFSSSAEAAAPAWAIDFSPKVDWYNVTDAGLVMIGTDKSISAVDPASGKVAWDREDLKKVGEIGVNFVPGTPTAMVLEAEYKLGQVPKGTLHMLDITTGKDLWTAQGGPVMWSKPMYKDHALLYLTQEATPKGPDYTMHYVDLVSGTQKWAVEDYFGKPNTVLAMWPADPTRKMSPKMTLDGNQDIVMVDGGAAYLELWTEKQGLVKRDLKTGAALWSNPTNYVDNLVPIPRNHRPTIVVAGGHAFVTDNGGRLLAYNIADGKPIWEEKDAPKMLGTIFKVIPIGNNVLVTGDDTKTAFAMVIDGSTGQEAWQKPVKMGGLTQFLEVEPDGRVIIAEGKATGTVVHVIDSADGSEKLEAKKLPGGVSYAEVMDGRFFATGSNGSKTYVDMVDLTTGQSAWGEEGYRAKGTIANLVVDQGKVYFVDSRNHFNALDLSNGSQTADVELPIEGNDEVVSTLTHRSNGLFVTWSSQNALGINADGSIAWHDHYPPPPPTGLQIVAGAAMIAAAAAAEAGAAGSAYQAGAYSATPGYGAYSVEAETAQANADSLSDVSAAFGAAATEVLKRAKASQASENYYFILTKVGDGKEGGVGVVRIDLDSGKEAGQVVLDTRDPNYKIDEIGGWLYLLRDDTKLEGYKLGS